MLLKEFQIYENREEYGNKFTEFTFQTQCITTLYMNFFPEFNTTNISKINICCGMKFSEIKISQHIDGILVIFMPFDVEHFFTLNDEEKKIKILNCLQKGVLWLADQMKWDEKPFIDTYSKVCDTNYEWKYTWKKPKSSPNRKYKAVVEYEITLYSAKLFLSILNKENDYVTQILVAEEKPNVYLLDMFLGELKWYSNEEVRLYRKYTRNPESNFVSLII